MSSELGEQRAQMDVTIAEIKKRLDNDAVFRGQVESDPVGALVAAGLPENAIVAGGGTTTTAAEVSGYLAPNEEKGTCLIMGIEDCWLWIKY